MLRFVPLTPAFCGGRRPFLRLLLEAAEALGGHVEAEEGFAHVARYSTPGGVPHLLFGNAMALNSDASASLAADKDYCARLLAEAGLPAPEGQLVVNDHFATQLGLKNAAAAAGLPRVAAAEGFAAARGFPLYLKPNRSSGGTGVSRVDSGEELRRDLAELLIHHTHVLVQAPVAGRDYRVITFDGTVRIAYERCPLSVTGDGTTSLKDLIGSKLEEMRRTKRGAKLEPGDPRIARHLAQQGFRAADVPSEGQAVTLLALANVSLGAEAVDITETLCPEAAILALEASKALGLRLAGVDILAPDLAASAEGAVVLEVNSSPTFDGYASASPDQWARGLALQKDLLRAL